MENAISNIEQQRTRRPVHWDEVAVFSVCYWGGIPLGALLFQTFIQEQPTYFEWKHIVLGPILFFAVEWSLGAAVYTLVFAGLTFVCIVQPVLRFDWISVAFAFIGSLIWMSAGLFVLSVGLS